MTEFLHCFKFVVKNLPINAYEAHGHQVTVRHLPCMLVIGVCIRFCGISLHSATNASLSSCKVLGYTGLSEVARRGMSHACPIGFRSGDRAGQSIQTIVSCFS